MAPFGETALGEGWMMDPEGKEQMEGVSESRWQAALREMARCEMGGSAGGPTNTSCLARRVTVVT